MQMRRIFVLTGAGVSADSGLGTFRDKGGLWTKYRIEDVATIAAYERDPVKVLDFYNMRRKVHKDAQPNAAHYALAKLQNAWESRGGTLTLCTQNIDNLHEKAGARHVLHMHGEIGKARCHECGDLRDAGGDFHVTQSCEACGRLGTVRPHVVWFGEQPLFLEDIFEALAQIDLFVAVGTSGAVYPAAGFVDLARRRGVPAMEFNLEPSDNAHLFNDARYGKAVETVPAWIEELIGAAGV
jgi:NAD-dependent deacetylase